MNSEVRAQGVRRAPNNRVSRAPAMVRARPGKRLNGPSKGPCPPCEQLESVAPRGGSRCFGASGMPENDGDFVVQ